MPATLFTLSDDMLDVPVNPITMQPYDDVDDFDLAFDDALTLEMQRYDADPTGGAPSRY
jgi:hypothetical protein